LGLGHPPKAGKRGKSPKWVNSWGHLSPLWKKDDINAPSLIRQKLLKKDNPGVHCLHESEKE